MHSNADNLPADDSEGEWSEGESADDNDNPSLYGLKSNGTSGEYDNNKDHLLFICRRIPRDPRQAHPDNDALQVMYHIPAGVPMFNVDSYLTVGQCIPAPRMEHISGRDLNAMLSTDPAYAGSPTRTELVDASIDTAGPFPLKKTWMILCCVWLHVGIVLITLR